MMHESKKQFLTSCVFIGWLSLYPFAIFADEEPKQIETQQPAAASSNNGYTINYNTVSIIEYIKFASKICNANFIFNEADLPFTVTVVSDAPISPENVMATLIQTLRIHGLMILEQGNNLVIHKSTTVRQPATLVFDDQKTDFNVPIVTRVFRLKNANVDSVAAIIRPMISDEALIEVSHETRQVILTDATMVVEKIAALIENLDSPHSPLEIRLFESKFNKPDYLIELASQIMNPIAQGNSFILVPQMLANSIFIVSTPELNEKAVSVLNSLDTPPKKSVLAERKIKSEDIFVIKLEHRSGEEILRSLKEIANNLQESGILENDLLETIDTAKWIRETNSLMFVGSPEATVKIKEFVSSLDMGASQGEGNTSFFVYKPVNRTIEEMQKSMQEMAENLIKTKGADDAIITTIRSQKANPLTHTLLFAGNPTTFAKVRELLVTVDTPSKGSKLLSRSNFIVYKLQSASFEDIDASLKSFAKNLENSGLSEEGIINAINSVKLIKETNSLVFVGSDETLKRIMEILPQLDAGAGQQSVPPSTQFLAYKPKLKKGEILVKSIHETSEQLKTSLADPALLHTLESVKWVKNTNTLLFTGDLVSLKKVEDLLVGIDLPDQKSKPSYFVYKLQNPRGDAVEEDLENMLKNMKAAGMKDSSLVKVIESMRFVKETNSLLLTGEASAIDEVKDLIAKYDTPRPSTSSSYSNFFMYKPQNEQSHKIEKSLKDIATSLKKAELYDPDLLAAIFSMRYVDTTNSFVFTGTPDAVAKIQELLKEIDAPTPQSIHVGKNTYLLYKLKNANGQQITAALKTISQDLKKSGTTDLEFLSALNSMKFVRETNSLMFTGSEETLTKLQGLVEKFDITNLGGGAPAKATGNPTEFFVYKPQSLSGLDLELTLRDFATNLKSSGLSDPNLFETLDTMKYTEKTQTLVFTGTQKSLDRVKDLLKEFDTSSNLPGGSAESSIQTIDNTSFLVYKLEFHKGDEIQNAMRQIAKDLTGSSANVNQGLLNSINSLQWIEVTNSLLCSGDPDTLTRLKELIKSLDVPLKQVFIEILVIETTLTNALQFGLEWGGKVKYKNKVSGSFNNFAPYTGTGTYPPANSFESNLQAINATTHPNPTNIPFAPQFDLGVIGDIIKHNGQSFVSLGSLMNALETDGETSVVMTPKIIAQDSRTATIFSGQNVPFAGSFVSTTGASSVQTSNLEYRDIGMNLSITPVLGNSDIITLDISLDNSAQTSSSYGANISFGTNAPTAQGITTSRTTMNTTVHVPNNNFLILSGMVYNSNTRSKTGIPCLGGIPLIGSAFSTNNDSNNNRNVVIFLRPTIINSAEDMKRLSADQEDFFRNQAGTPALEHNFDEGMEYIKSSDDE